MSGCGEGPYCYIADVDVWLSGHVWVKHDSYLRVSSINQDNIFLNKRKYEAFTNNTLYLFYINIILNSKCFVFKYAILVIISKPSKNKIQFKVCCWQSLFYTTTISQFWRPTPANAHFLVIITVATISPESDPVTINVCSNIHVFNATATLQFHLNIFSALFKDKQMHIVSKLCQNFAEFL